jgi:uroporphyrinogen decarboxylase
MASSLERFLACMEYEGCDRRPNFELGVWAQTVERWRAEAPESVEGFGWDWFVGEDALGLDRREFIPVDYGFVPRFEEVVLEETDEYVVMRDENGVVRRALKRGSVDGQRMCMDQFLRFPVVGPGDFAEVRRRLAAGVAVRYPASLDEDLVRWRERDFPLVLGRNCAANGFYWRAREFMGTEGLSFAWYDFPDLMDEMMEFFADFVIETSRPVLARGDVEYFVLNEDFSMKNGPLLSPEMFRRFIFRHLVRLVEFLKGHGVRYVVVDSDGDPRKLVPLLMDAGVDGIWPLERAAGMDPVMLRREFGRSLRLWGGVDKRVLARGREAILGHLAEMIPLIEEGGFIPTVDHTVPPDVSWDDFRFYMDAKSALISGEFERLR